MLDNLRASIQHGHLGKGDVISQLGNMQSGDILAYFIRPQHAAVIFRKQESRTLYESFKVSPSRDAVLNTERRLVCSYVGKAIGVPKKVFDNAHFQTELANFLSLPGKVNSDPLNVPVGHPEYITALLTGILRAVGHVVEGSHILKHVGDEVGMSERKEDEWRRSSLWLLIRVAIQTSLDRSSLGRASYKAFTLFFICNLAKDVHNAGLCSNLLHLISCKILRRLSKLGTSAYDWLSDMALKTSTCLQDTLEVRAMEIQATKPPSPYWNPSELDLVRDTQLSLPHSGEYIRNAHANTGRNPTIPPFHPKDYYRGSLEDFLSSSTSFFAKAYAADPYVALYDVEQLVEQGIDQWVARVTNADEACTQLGTLMDMYLSAASIPYADNPEYRSIMTLTALEMWVALDKLVVKDIPMVAEYSPELPRSLLESLLLREARNLQRLSCVYQYLFARCSRSREGLSVLSDDFTQDSFPARYCDSSLALQNLRARIEVGIVNPRIADDGHLPERGATRLALTFRSTRHQTDEDVGAAKSLVSILPLQSKVIAFELQCPTSFRVWRSATAHLLYRCDRTRIEPFNIGSGTRLHDPPSDIPELQPYLVEHLRENLPTYSQFYVAFFHSGSLGSHISPRLRYAFKWVPFCDERSRWWGIGDGPLSQHTTYYNFFDDDCDHLTLGPSKSTRSKFAKYTGNTIHTTNNVLSAQADCPAESSIDEFIALGHLRSGSSLQWVNILRELRGRTLNFRSREVYFLLAQATSQVGQLDMNTGEWMWHQELYHSSFCNGLLDELESLFLDISTGSLDEVAMRTISLLLTRVLALSPSESVSKGVFRLLRGVRRKTLEWVQELAYNLMQEPTNEERCRHLYNMAATCRSTFNVTTSLLRKVLHSAEDIEAFLSCAFFIQATSHVLHSVKCTYRNCRSGHFSASSLRDHSELLCQRDRRLSVAVETVLSDAIQADVTDRGIDLAVRNIWPGYQPGPRRWEPEQCPNSHWLACTTAATADRRPHIARINLLDGSLLVDGQPLGGLPQKIREHPLYNQIFYHKSPLVIPSDLPGMDFVTLATIFNHFVHFSLRGNDLVIRAQREDANDVLELVPAEIFRGDLPTFLVEGHVHWLNLSASDIEIEIRPHKSKWEDPSIWEQSAENWRIVYEHGKYHACKDSKSIRLVDIQSRTCAMASSLLECLDSPENLVVTTSSSPAPRLSVALPHYGLSFFVNNDGDLESNDFKEMVYDENQGIGTLFGLVNRLVLRAKGEVERGIVARIVLVPNDPFRLGIGKWRFLDPYHFFKVDTELGCLTGNSSQESKTVLAYLHAKTSIDWWPDPLTGWTGAHEALSILASAGCQSSRGAHPLLWNLFGDVSPWHPQIFLADGVGIGEDFLLRGAGRAEYLFPPNIVTLVPTFPRDYENTNYVSSLEDLELEDVVYTAAFVVYNQPVDVLTTSTISNWAELWGDTMSGVTTHSPSTYDGTLLSPNLPQAVSTKVHDILQKHDNDDSQRFQLLLLLPTLAYRSSHPQTAFLTMFLAFVNGGKCSLVNHADYKLLDGYCPTEQVLRYHINASRLKDRTWDEDSARHSVDTAVECLLETWPSDIAPSLSLDPNLWDMASLSPTLQALFSSYYHNLKLKEHLTRVLRDSHPVPSQHTVSHLQDALGQSSDTPPHALWNANSARYHHKSSPPSVPSPPSSLQHTTKHLPWRVTLDQLLSERRAPVLPNLTKLIPHKPDGDKCAPPDTPAFDRLLSFFRANESDSPFQADYITDLHASARHVREEYENTYGTMRRIPMEDLKKHFVHCRDKCRDALCILKESLGPSADLLEQALARGGQWPQITAFTLLQCIASVSPINLSQNWKHCLVSLCLLLLECQRARRLLQFAAEGLEEEFSRELENEGCDGWDAEQYPDWLLIQLQGNFLIRRKQVNIAMEMISPRSGENTVMQVGMGEGKSSVIIPITAAALADGHQLVRVIVPKRLVNQMFNLLVDRLGGLANRQIHRLHFSRSDHWEESVLSWKMSNCMDKRGIFLAEPEDVLSLKLTSVEKRIPECRLAPMFQPSGLHKLIHDYNVATSTLNLLKDSYLANVFRGLSGSLSYPITRQHADDTTQDDAFRLTELQKWLHSHSRDILDECDEILHTRRQLIYTVGYPEHVDGYPDRWTIIQKILRLVKQHASSLSKNLPDSVEYRPGPKPGSFPHLRILRTSDAGQQLISLLVRDIMAGHLPTFHFRLLNETQRATISDFISSEHLDFDIAREVKDYASRSQQSNLWNGLLLLRGLFASNILLSALAERRWRVDYGLHPHGRNYWDPKCTRLAVPYRDKDVPVPNTQFGHPDITILLTCLSYYYYGLSKEQLRISFQTLLNQDNPATEYAHWVQDYGSNSLPPSVQSIKEFNLESSEQWDNCLFPIFAYNQAAIDFYLSHIVFPKEAKEYPWKLAASSWDLGEKRERPITGFSGTSDARYLLPTSIAQHQLENQEGANAKVLGHLLRHENLNDSYMLMVHDNTRHSKTLELLKIIVTQKPEIRVLLDVGAQILDASNRDLAQKWLKLSSTDGAVYFDDTDELVVLTKSGATQPLNASPLAQQLDRCVIYLDDAHTRGTDLKFPKGFRAAVTLGPKVTKDRLVQGCMRMRKLGNGHSVMFFAPLEVDQSIRSVTHKEDRNVPITTADILKWAIHETWADIRQQAPYWAQQGMSHKTRYDAWSRFCNDDIAPEQLADAWLQPETKSLDDLYAPREDQSASGSTSSELEKDIGRRCKQLGVAKLSVRGAQLDEQLERQVNQEIEREREVELPPKAEPADHSLHQDVANFVRTGTIRKSSAFRPLFTSLEKSSAANKEGYVGWSPFILATADFCETIKQIPANGRVDQYLRPVQWVLSGKKDGNRVLVVVSPFEADRLMPDIRISKYVHLHVYIPRTSKRMKPADDLMFYSIPPVPANWTPPWDLIDQLNVFAGQLYLRDWDAYSRLSHFLDVQKQLREDKRRRAVRYNLFNLGSRKELQKAHPDSLLPSVMMLLAIRRRGLPFAETDMGKILEGRSLTEEDFACPAPTSSSHELVPSHGQMQLSIWSGSTSASASSSDSDMDCDEEHRPGTPSSKLAQRSKRGLPDADHTSEIDSGRPKKLLRVD